MAVVTDGHYEWKFSDLDVCNPDDATWEGDYNPYNKRLWLLHDHGFTVAVVWADSLQDALDEAVDCDKMDRYLVNETNYSDYVESPEKIWDCEQLAFLGNASEPFDIESLGVVEIPTMKKPEVFGDTVKITKIGYVHFGC